MWRIIFELAGFFILPFVCYAGFVVWQERHPRAAKKILHAKAFRIQALIGMIFVVLSLVVFGLADDKRVGGYSPAIFKDGKLVPGRVE